jgi:hypothetical protein
MRGAHWLGGLLVAAAVLAGCSLFSGGLGFGTELRPYAKDTWESDWAPLEEFAPLARDPDYVTFTSTDEILLGIEGYLVFVRLEDASGTIVADHRTEFTSTLVPGTYTVTGYYRNCDGNCGYLDPPVPLCTTTVDVQAGESPTVVVSVEGKTCTVERPAQFSVTVHCSIAFLLEGRWWAWDQNDHWPPPQVPSPGPDGVVMMSAPYPVSGVVTITDADHATFQADIDGSIFQLTGHPTNPDAGSGCL